MTAVRSLHFSSSRSSSSKAIGLYLSPSRSAADALALRKLTSDFSDFSTVEAKYSSQVLPVNRVDPLDDASRFWRDSLLDFLEFEHGATFSFPSSSTVDSGVDVSLHKD